MGLHSNVSWCRSFLVDGHGEDYSSEDEKIWWQGVALSEATGRFEETTIVTIDIDGDGFSSDAYWNEGQEFVTKTESLHDLQ